MANNGWLLDMGSKKTETLRFTAWGESLGDYPYSETNSSKIVQLTQYDNRDASGEVLNFTREEDMGWNLKGMPWLVSGYRTDDPLGGEDFRMNIPHLFYSMDIGENDGLYKYFDKADGKIYTSRSWDDGATLSVGEGFFTQTAAFEKFENLTFKLPVIAGGPILLAPRPIVLMRDLDNEGDLLTVNPDEGAPKTINYSLGRDGVKWMMTDAPQLYLLSAAKSRLS